MLGPSFVSVFYRGSEMLTILVITGGYRVPPPPLILRNEGVRSYAEISTKSLTLNQLSLNFLIINDLTSILPGWLSRAFQNENFGGFCGRLGRRAHWWPAPIRSLLSRKAS